MTKGRTRLRYSLFGLLGIIIILFTYGFSTHTAKAAGETDGGTQSHKQFNFSAYLERDEIIDGTGLDSHMTQPGYDNAPDNGIVRTFDTVSYPIQITVNPKGAGALKDIVLEVTGELEGGFDKDGRATARFALDGQEDKETNKVTFKTTHKMARTGSAITFPVTVETLAAKHGAKFKPNIKVQVVSVEGEDIRDDNVIVEFNDVPETEITAAVAVDAYAYKGMASRGVPYVPLSSITGNSKDTENIHTFHIGMHATNLPGKNSIKGSTFPEPGGKLNFDINMNGKINWAEGPNKDKGFTAMPFTSSKRPIELFDYRENSTNKTSVGAKNTLMSGKSYTFDDISTNYAPFSKMPNFKASTINNRKNNHVWDSGKWHVNKPSFKNNVMNYTGYNTDYVIGSTFPIYAGYINKPNSGVHVPDRTFSTQVFVVQTGSDYAIGDKGTSNPKNYSNDINYNIDVLLKSYTEPSGKTVSFNNKKESITLVEYNRKIGTYNAYIDFSSDPGNIPLGYLNSNMRAISKGNAHTLIGEDVNMRAFFKSNIAFRGGMDVVYNWNTDAFTLTKDRAERGADSIMRYGYRNLEGVIVKNDSEHQSVRYGVPKFKGNAFETLRTAKLSDYSWYSSYDSAAKNGKVGAMRSVVTAPVGEGFMTDRVMIPLKVNHDKIGIGSTSSADPRDANIVNILPVGYVDESRKIKADVGAAFSLGQPAIWNKDGVMEKIQNPTRTLANFETLGVVPAEISTTLKPGKSTYTSADIVDWKSTSSIKLPSGEIPEGFDSRVKVIHELPAGLDYVPGSGKVDEEEKDPVKITEDDKNDGSKEMVWETDIDTASGEIPDIEFKTKINTKALGQSVTSSASIYSYIESDLDNRPEHFRSSTGEITIRRLGQLDVTEQIIPMNGRGPMDSNYEIRVSPSTSEEAEPDIVGLKVLPQNGRGASKFSGKIELTNIRKAVMAGSNLKANDIDIYVNNKVVESNQPQKINFSKNGWTKYKNGVDLSKVKTVAFKLNGDLSFDDDVTIRLNFSTSGNAFGDVYLNETVMNSARNYDDSVRDEVLYRITPDLELQLDRFRIYTDKASKGLPTETRMTGLVGGHVENQNFVNNLNFALAIYEVDSNKKVAEKKFKYKDFEVENEILIPKDGLEKGTDKTYEVRLEGYDENHVWVREGNDSISTDGHVSTEATLGRSKVGKDGKIKFTGITMTERERGKEMVEFDETITMTPFDPVTVKSGYGFALDADVTYENDYLETIRQAVDGVNESSDGRLSIDKNMIDESLSYYDESKNKNLVPLDTDVQSDDIDDTDDGEDGKFRKDYVLPELRLDPDTGLTYTAAQVEGHDKLTMGNTHDAGRELYVPVWIDRLGKYDANFQTTRPIGSHFIKFDVATPINVPAYMFHHIDSETGDQDELLVRPVERDELPDMWQTDENGKVIEE